MRKKFLASTNATDPKKKALTLTLGGYSQRKELASEDPMYN